MENKKVKDSHLASHHYKHGKKSDVQLLFVTHDLIFSYIFRITLYILPLILFNNSLYHKPSHHTLSNDFSKSMKVQYNIIFSSF